MTDQVSVVQRARAMLLKRRELKEKGSEEKYGVQKEEEKIKEEQVEPLVETIPEVVKSEEVKPIAVEATPIQVEPQASLQESQPTTEEQSDKESFESAKEEPQVAPTSKTSTSSSSTARPADSAPVKTTSTPPSVKPEPKSAPMEAKKLDVHAFFQPAKTVPPPSTSAAPSSRLFKVASNDAFRDASAARSQPVDARASWGRQQFATLPNPPSYRSPPPRSLRELFSPPPIAATAPGAFYPSAHPPPVPVASPPAFFPSTPAYPTNQISPALDTFYPPSPPLWEPARPSKGVTLSRTSVSSASGPTPSSSTSVSPSVSRGMPVPESETVDSQDEEQFYYPSENSTQAMSPSTDSPEMSNTLSSLQLSLAIKDAPIPKDLPVDDPRFSTVYSLLHSTLLENAKLSLRLEVAQKRIDELAVGSPVLEKKEEPKKEEPNDQSALNQEAISLVVDLEEDLNSARSQLDLLLTKLNEAYSDYIELATSSCTLIQSELTIQEDLVDRINQVESQYNNLRRRAIEKVEAAQQELEAARKQIKSQQTELETLGSVKQQVETLQAALDTSEKQNQQSLRKLDDAVQKSQKLHQKSDDLIGNIQQMQREIVGLAARARKAETTNKEKKLEYNQTVVRHVKEAQALETKLDETERAFSTLKTRFEKVEKERFEATMLLAELTKGDSDKGSGNEEENNA